MAGAAPIFEGSSARRDEIVRVASALFRERGLSVSLQDIADHLGVTYNALYHHFRSREDLVLHCLLWASTLLDEAMDEAVAAGGTGLDQVLAFLRNTVSFSVREQTASGWLSVSLSPEGQQRLAEASGPGWERLAKLIAAGVKDGSIARCEPRATTAWIMHTIYWWPHELDADMPMEATAKTIMGLIARALAA